MKKVLALLLAVFICDSTMAQVEAPKEVSAQENLLRYNSVGVSYSKTTYKGSSADLTGIGLSFSKDLSPSAFFIGGYADSSQAVTNAKIGIGSIGLGFHTPISANVDAVISAELASGSVKVGASSASVNGNAISLNLRGMVTPKIEAGLSGTYVSVTSGSVTTTDTQTAASIGFNLSSSVQIGAGVNFKSDQTMVLGVKLFF